MPDQMILIPKEPRNGVIDILKTISIVGILIIHISASGFLTYPINSFNWYASVFWGTLIRFSVPVFFMCSGALLLDPRKEITLKTLYGKYLLRIIAALFFWAAAYELFGIIVGYISTGVWDSQQIITAAKNLILFRHHFHLYYLHIIILVYVFLPITRVFVGNATKSQLKYALIIWFLAGILYPFIKQFYPFTLLSGIPLQYSINMTYSAIGYGIAGYYLKEYKSQQWAKYAVLYLLGFLLVFTGTSLGSVSQGAFNSMFLEGMTPGVAFMAIGLFGAVSAKYADKPGCSPVRKLSLASFCIFLVHDFFNIIFNSIGFNIHLFSPWLAIPVITAANLLLSYGVYLVIAKIPVANKYLI